MWKKPIITLILLVLPYLVFKPNAFSWGFYAHKRINRIAVFTLPKGMYKFYKSYIDYVTEHAVDPDKRRYTSDDEAPRHYIDIDHYGPNRFEIVPHRWDSAVAKLSEDTLLAYGIVPWHINVMYYRLREAFKKKDRDQILRLSSDIGHYIADSHVPLHTTENYDGQMTNQKGIHGFWESRLPELFADNYDYLVGSAVFIDVPLEKAWATVYESHMALDSVLSFEKELTETMGGDKKYAYEEKGARVLRTYSQEFSAAYHDKLSGMVERRMRKAIHTVGSFWFTAWVDAGQPDLDDLVNPEISQQHLKDIEKENREWKRGQWKGRNEGQEETDDH